jgi:ribosomal protein L37AE/L43A
MSENDTDPSFEKYAVVEDNEDATKTAAEGKTCPSCGAALEKLETTNVVKCPNCGTKPFEGGHVGSTE